MSWTDRKAVRDIVEISRKFGVNEIVETGKLGWWIKKQAKTAALKLEKENTPEIEVVEEPNYKAALEALMDA